MAAVRSLRVSVKSDSGSDRSDSDSEPMEVEDGEVEAEDGELEADDIPVNRPLKELLPDTSRRYENKAGAFITGIDVNSKEAIEKKEKRARRFHFCAEVNLAQRNVVLDKDVIKKAIPAIRLEAIYMTGVDDMSTQDVFGYFKEYPPAHIEWIDDTSCNVVWLDDVTSTRALINSSRMPDPEAVTTETDDTKQPGKPIEQSKGHRNQSSDEDDDDDEEEGEVDEEEASNKNSVEREGKDSEGDTDQTSKADVSQMDHLSQVERESLLQNDLRPAIKPFKGNKLFLRFATQDDKKEPGAARRSRYYMKYGNPNYGGMKGILSNSWKRRFHTRRIQRDVIKSKKPLIGDGLGHTPPYTHTHSADLVNLPEEPIKEEEEEEEDEEDEEEEDMDSDDRVVEYRERGERSSGLRSGGSGGLRSRAGRSPSTSSDSDEMDYDLELKMISTPSPKKSMKMTMYADELETNLKSIRNSVRSESSSGSGVRNRIGAGAGAGAGAGLTASVGSAVGSLAGTKTTATSKVTDVRQLLEEKRQGFTQNRQHLPETTGTGKTDVRQRLGKRRRSPSPVSLRDTPPPREPTRDVHSRLGVASQDSKGLYSNSSKDRKTSRLWSRLGPSDSTVHDDDRQRDPRPSARVSTVSTSSRLGDPGDSRSRKRRDEKEDLGEAVEEEDDSTLQRMWGAMIKQKQEQLSHKMKKSRLDNLPSLQIEISRDSSDGSESDS
ncbi:nuclear cap-binding protein subunit 3 isoform 2-T2 [Polymixia lowei]